LLEIKSQLRLYFSELRLYLTIATLFLTILTSYLTIVRKSQLFIYFFNSVVETSFHTTLMSQ